VVPHADLVTFRLLQVADLLVLQLTLHRAGSPLLALDQVGQHEEVREEHQQRHDVVQVGNDDARRVLVAAVVQQVGGLSVHHHKLDHLAHGQRRLPPDVLGVQGDEVVGVHHGVNETIEHDGQVDVAVVAHVHVEPVELQQAAEEERISEVQCEYWRLWALYQEDAGVVVHVQEAELLPPLLQDDEDRVEEVKDLGQVKYV
jgi:hypothetical protein